MVTYHEITLTKYCSRRFLNLAHSDPWWRYFGGLWSVKPDDNDYLLFSVEND